jgi:Replication initiation factor.
MSKLYPCSSRCNYVPLPAQSVGVQSRISCTPSFVTGIDKLEITLWLSCQSSEIFERFAFLKNQAQMNDISTVPVTFGGKKHFKWNLQRVGTKQFGFVLRSGDITMQLSSRSPDSSFPNCRVEIGSISCQEHGFTIYRRLLDWMRIHGFQVEKELVSRVDLATDCLNVNIDGLGASLRERWITKAKKFSVYYDGLHLTGIMLGKGDICLRIYDKSRELNSNKTKKQFFKSLWQCEEDTPVTRVEFQLRRPVLKDFELAVNTVRELEENIDSLWQFCCTDWARLARRSVDRKNRNYDLVILSTLWRKIQAVIFRYPSPSNFRSKKI